MAHTLKTPIATGERLYTRFGFRKVLEKQAAAVIQPDVLIWGGIMELKKIAAMALSQWPVLRAFARMDLAQAVKTLES